MVIRRAAEDGEDGVDGPFPTCNQSQSLTTPASPFPLFSRL